jgi:retron-type reverse transcriptase
VLVGGMVDPMDEGVPQGGPLSPLLSNLMLDVHDPNAIDALRFGTRISFRWVATSKPRRSRLSGPPARQW